MKSSTGAKGFVTRYFPSAGNRQSFEKLRQRVLQLVTQYNTQDGLERDPLLKKLSQMAKVKVVWEPKEAWSRIHGSALLTAFRGGFVVRMPEHTSLRWKRFVLAHEIGHTLFFDLTNLLSQSEQLDTDLRMVARMPLSKDIWVAKELEEALCDDIADILLMPGSVVQSCLISQAGRLGQVNEIANRCCVPIDRAFRRWTSASDMDRGTGKLDSCVEIAVWEVQQESVNSKKGPERVKLLYAQGQTAKLYRGLYSAAAAGFSAIRLSDLGTENSSLVQDQRVHLPNLSGQFNLEVLPLNSTNTNDKRCFFVFSYDRRDGGPGYFARPLRLCI